MWDVLKRVLDVIKRSTKLDFEYFVLNGLLFFMLTIGILVGNIMVKDACKRISKMMWDHLVAEELNVDRVRQITVTNKTFQAEQCNLFYSEPVFVEVRKVPNVYDRRKSNILKVEIVHEEH